MIKPLLSGEGKKQSVIMRCFSRGFKQRAEQGCDKMLGFAYGKYEALMSQKRCVGWGTVAIGVIRF